MITVKLQAHSRIFSSAGNTDSPDQTISLQLREGASLWDLFSLLAAQHPDFREKVFDPHQGRLNNQMLIIFKSGLIQERDLKSTLLKDQDSLIFTPILVGG